MDGIQPSDKHPSVPTSTGDKWPGGQLNDCRAIPPTNSHLHDLLQELLSLGQALHSLDVLVGVLDAAQHKVLVLNATSAWQGLRILISITLFVVVDIRPAASPSCLPHQLLTMPTTTKMPESASTTLMASSTCAQKKSHQQVLHHWLAG